MRYQDIPQYTDWGSYEVDVGWNYLETHLQHYLNDGQAKLDMDPDFQRAHVWDEEKQQRYVEYVLRGGHSGKSVFFNHTTWHNVLPNVAPWFVLVDGKQRLEAVRKYLRGELAIFGGHYIKDFTDNIRIVRASFRFHVNCLATRAEVLQWYLDLNEGGVVHTREELDKVRMLLAAEKK